MFYISDITGHGLDAALMSGFVENTMSCLLSHLPEEIVRNPAKLLRLLARQYAQKDYPEHYAITILLGIIDPKKNTLTYSSAGIHVPPLLIARDGSLTELTAGNLPISAMIPPEHQNYANIVVDMSPGATLFFSTDGLTEQESEGNVYGNRHYSILQEQHDLPPQAIAECINDDFKAFTGCISGDDDITYMMFQVEEAYPKLDFALHSFLEAVEPAKRRVQSFFAQYMDDTDIVMMAFHEVLLNAVEHGNQLDPEKQVNIHCECKERYVLARVSNEGEGFDWRNVVRGKEDLAAIQEDVADRGRGLGFALTKAAADYFYFNDKGNQATLIKLR